VNDRSVLLPGKLLLKGEKVLNSEKSGNFTSNGLTVLKKSGLPHVDILA